MIKTIMKIVRTRAVTTPMTRPTASFGAVIGAPVRASPPKTTLLQTSAITNPNAVPSDVEIVLRTSTIEIFRSSAKVIPRSGMDGRILRPTASVGGFLLGHDPDGFDRGTRILTLRVLLERFHHVPDRQEGDCHAVEGLHLHPGLVRRFDGGRYDDAVRAHVERHARGRDWNRMGVREDLPDDLHRLERGDFRRRDHVAFLEPYPALAELRRKRLRVGGRRPSCQCRLSSPREGATVETGDKHSRTRRTLRTPRRVFPGPLENFSKVVGLIVRRICEPGNHERGQRLKARA